MPEGIQLSTLLDIVRGCRRQPSSMFPGNKDSLSLRTATRTIVSPEHLLNHTNPDSCNSNDATCCRGLISQDRGKSGCQDAKAEGSGSSGLMAATHPYASLQPEPQRMPMCQQASMSTNQRFLKIREISVSLASWSPSPPSSLPRRALCVVFHAPFYCGTRAPNTKLTLNLPPQTPHEMACPSVRALHLASSEVKT